MEIFGDLIRKVYDLGVSQPLAKYTNGTKSPARVALRIVPQPVSLVGVAHGLLLALDQLLMG